MISTPLRTRHFCFRRTDREPGQNVNYKRPVYWLCVSWYLLATILSNAYKGKVFEITCSPTFPLAPQTIDQIPDSGFPIISSLDFVDFQLNTWQSAVGKAIGHLINDSRDGILRINNLESYVRIKENLIWCHLPRIQFMVNLLKRGIARNTNGKDIQVGLNISSFHFKL